MLKHEVDGGHNDHGHQDRGHEPPHDLPVEARPHSRHPLNVTDIKTKLPSKMTLSAVMDLLGEPLVTIHIHHGDQLSEGDEGEPRGPEAVKQSEPVLACPGSEHQADGEAGDGHAAHQDRLLDVLEAGLVKQSAHHALEDADLGAEAETEQHHEEEGGPEGGAGDLGEHVRHDDEGESCSLGRVIQLLDKGTVLQEVVRMVSRCIFSMQAFYRNG